MDTVWLYWENRYSGRLPDYLALCLESIRKNAKTCTVVTPTTLEDYVQRSTLPRGFQDLAPNHKSDYLRVRLLHDFGGMWIDIDTVVFRSIDKHMLDPLREHPVVTIGSKFAQQMFAAQPGVPFLASSLRAIHRRIESGQKLKWNDLGSTVLYPAVEGVQIYSVSMKGWLYGWREWEKFLEAGDADYDNRLCCMLYNKMLFPRLKDMSRAEILQQDWLLSSMLRKALG